MRIDVLISVKLFVNIVRGDIRGAAGGRQGDSPETGGDGRVFLV